MKQAFVSYVFEDLNYRETIEQWVAAGRLGVVHLVCEQEDMRQQGEAAIRAHLSPRLQGASTLLLLVGDNTHNHSWVAYEVAHMRSAGKPIVVVRLPETTGAPPPSAVGLPSVTFEPDAIRRAIGN